MPLPHVAVIASSSRPVASSMILAPFGSRGVIDPPPRKRIVRPLAYAIRELDNSMRLVPVRGRFTGRLRIRTRQDPDNPNPTFLPLANEVAQRMADATGGVAQSWVTEALLGTPVTAHILGGAVPAVDA